MAAEDQWTAAIFIVDLEKFFVSLAQRELRHNDKKQPSNHWFVEIDEP